MGLWTIAKGKLVIEPKAEEVLISDFIQFIQETCPPEYYHEKFVNPWFFDEDNNLVSHEGKFGEPGVWYYHLKDNFFKIRGYIVKGDPEIICEYDEEYKEICKKREKEYKKWMKRKPEFTMCSPRYYG